jgi:hypothetical protein
MSAWSLALAAVVNLDAAVADRDRSRRLGDIDATNSV